MRGYSIIACDNVRDKFNIGHIMRSAGCFDVSAIRFTNISEKFITKNKINTPHTEKHVPTSICNNVLDDVPIDCRKVAVEFIDDERTQPLTTYKHFYKSMYIFGGESDTLSDEILDGCDDIVYIPSKLCFNVAMATHIVLYDRMLKNRRGL